VLRALKEASARKVPKALKETKAHRARSARRATSDHKARKVIPVPKALRVLRAR
jgi:hypothetical protein